jgi:hypothetical protein
MIQTLCAGQLKNIRRNQFTLAGTAADGEASLQLFSKHLPRSHYPGDF